MRIGLNLLYLLPSVGGGTYTYALSLIKSLAECDKENQYFVFVGLEAANLEIVRQSNFHIILCPIRVRRRSIRYAWEQGVLPYQVHRLKIDLLHSLGYVAPLRVKCASIVTIPDVNYVWMSQTTHGYRRLVLKYFVPASARSSDHILTISKFSKGEILNCMKVPPEKVTVTYLGPRLVDTNDTQDLWPRILTQYEMPSRYVVAFSSSSTHKNIARLVRAFARASEGLPHRLVLIGHLPQSLEKQMRAHACNNRILTTGYVPDEYVFSLLCHAELFVYPSCYEGFGLPILEAQQAGVPIACSTAGSLPEVAGQGAAFFDPYSIEDMANVIRRCLAVAEVRETLVRNGHENLARFSWQKTAYDTLRLYHEVFSKKVKLRGS